MRFVNFWEGGILRAGVSRGDLVYDLLTIHEATKSREWAPTPEAVIAHGVAGLPTLERLLADATSVPPRVAIEPNCGLGPA